MRIVRKLVLFFIVMCPLLMWTTFYLWQNSEQYEQYEITDDNEPTEHGIWRHVAKRPVYLLSAFYDPRDTKGNAIIRVLGLVHHKHWREQLFCNIFYGNYWKCAGVAKPFQLNHLARTDGGKHIYWSVQFICPLDNRQLPEAVTLFSRPNCSDIQNYSIQVFNNFVSESILSPKTFGLCLSRLHHFDNTLGLFDAFENNFFFGVETVTVYKGEISEKAGKLLQKYVEEGRANIVPYTLPGIVARNIQMNGQSLAMNDCLYRNMNLVKYLLFTDTDEVIIPRTHNSWGEMLSSLPSEKVGAYIFRNAFFTRVNSTAKPDHGHNNAFQTWQVRVDYIHPPTVRSKIIAQPNRVIRVGNHLPFELVPGYNTVDVSISMGLMHHYRQEFPKDEKKMPTVFDNYAVKKFASDYNATYQKRLQQFNDVLNV